MAWETNQFGDLTRDESVTLFHFLIMFLDIIKDFESRMPSCYMFIAVFVLQSPNSHKTFTSYDKRLRNSSHYKNRCGFKPSYLFRLIQSLYSSTMLLQVLEGPIFTACVKKGFPTLSLSNPISKLCHDLIPLPRRAPFEVTIIQFCLDSYAPLNTFRLTLIPIRLSMLLLFSTTT